MRGPAERELRHAGMIGTVLQDSYRLTRFIGEGGMGAVFEGVQLRLQKRVAVKMMARDLAANEEALARFQREAEVTSQLGHPHIVHVFDFGAAPAGEPYLVMEFLEGEDLEHRIGRVGRLLLPAVAHVVKQVASALAATHGRGIVHRDLKPANIFLVAIEGEGDFVKVVDFGISKVKAAATKLTGASVVMGTPKYMSPEQATGQVDQIDHRTDQWALGCIAYEMLSGRSPFSGEDAASLLYQVVHQTPAPLASRVPGLPVDVEKVLTRALSKQLEGRFPTVTAFARAFEAAASGRSLPVDVAASATPAPARVAAPAPAARSIDVTTFSQTAAEVTGTVRSSPTRFRRSLLIAVAGVSLLIVALVVRFGRQESSVRPDVVAPALVAPPTDHAIAPAVPPRPPAAPSNDKPAVAAPSPPVVSPAPRAAERAVARTVDIPTSDAPSERPRKIERPARLRTGADAARASARSTRRKPSAPSPAVTAPPSRPKRHLIQDL